MCHALWMMLLFQTLHTHFFELTRLLGVLGRTLSPVLPFIAANRYWRGRGEDCLHARRLSSSSTGFAMILPEKPFSLFKYLRIRFFLLSKIAFYPEYYYLRFCKFVDFIMVFQ